MIDVIVGMGTCGISAGAQKIYDKFEEEIKTRDLPVNLKETGCIGMCYREVLVKVVSNGKGFLYGEITPDRVEEIVYTHLIKEVPIMEWVVQGPHPLEDDSFFEKQKRIVLRNCGDIDPNSIDEYLSVGGYQALQKVLTRYSPEKVIEEITNSRIRGRGGAGFLTGVKWNFAMKARGEKKYVICNADEGDPGAFMDRSVLEGDPHSVIEGMAICGYAIGSAYGYIYVRAEYPRAIQRLIQAIAQAEERGFLGNKVFQTDFDFRIKIKEGAGAFVCGEETALIASIEGHRGNPRLRPPFPAVSGLWKKPTNINNVETLANIPWIIMNGAGKYAALGTEDSKGTKVFALTGKVKRGGAGRCPHGACFLCVVEVEGRRGLVPSCSSMAEEGMVVHTSSKKIREARKTSLELMLSDHYADCFGPCKLTCPAGVDVQGYISLINLGKYREAIKLIKERNPLPLVCGRICVRECEIACRRGRVDAPVGIDYLKRYVADHDLSKMFVPERKPENGRRVAVIGGGPSGLTCAYYLALDGYPVTIFDSMPKLGGMLRYGIPEYRLPKEILDKEIDSIIGLGIEVETDCKLGEDFHIPDLFKRGYEAVFVGLGAQQSTDMRIEGEKAEGIISGIGFLRDIELKGMSSLDGRVVVVGGGNTAIDAARTSLRVGADEVTLLYRRTIQEMPAHSAEIKAAEEEGVNFIFLSAPAKVITSNGRLSAVECVKMSLGEPDASGRRRPVPIKGSEYILHCNYVISAIGQAIDPSGLDKDAKIEITKRGRISVNPLIMETSYPGVFAGGDAVSGPATAIEAIDHGRKAAISIHNYLNQNQQKSVMYEFKSKKDIFGGPDEREFESIPNLPGEIMPEIPIAQRIHNFHEIEMGLQEDQVKTESSRCLECGCNYIYDCLLKKYATQYGITDLLYKGDVNRYKVDDRHPFIVLDSNKCIQCGKCVRTCAEILDVSALGFVYRGFRTIVKPSMEKPLQATNCISCGNCISTCPTVAITEKLPYKKQGPWVMKETPSICHYCSIGCNLSIKHKADDLFFVTTSNGKSLNNGYLCSKGKFGYYYHLNNTDRNTTPKIKREGRLVDVSWQEAIEFAGQRLMEIKKRYGPDSIALFASSELSNEELYLIQKLGRGVIGTNNIGSFANSLIPKDLNALDESLGITASTNPMIELKKADVIMLINSDPTEEHPVLGFTIKNLAKKNLTKLIVARSMERRHLKNQVYELRKDFRVEDLKNKEAFKDIFTRSGSMIKILHYIEKISNTRSSVLIWGESGTGKELVARSIHAASPRKDKKFIAVNAGVFATELFPSEFFGHVKGSFTGAYTDKKGFIEEADGGTLFLDEIGELSLPIQVKLLRVLQEREFFRMGSTQSIKVDTRIIACTNKDLQIEIEKGNFRKDLFYRLNISSIHIPPLRERKEDILPLAHYFIEKYNKINRKDINDIIESVMKLLQKYDYPGNIRELENIINHMVSVESSKRLREESLPQYFIESFANNHKGIPFSFGETSLMNVQREHIKNVLEHTGGNRTKTAAILGISRVSLISKIKKYKL